MSTTIFHLEMLAPADLRPKACPDPAVRVKECALKQAAYNRFLYQLVGGPWRWTDKLVWSDEQWRGYAEAPNLRTWVAYQSGSPLGYFELQEQAEGNVEIAYFGLAPAALGRGLGGFLLTRALEEAWGWGPRRVWVHTCDKDHPAALPNYQARGMRLFKTEVKPSAGGAAPGHGQP